MAHSYWWHILKLVAHNYVINGKMTLKYRSKSVFMGGKRERLIRFSLLTNPLLSSEMCLDHVSLLSILAANNLV